MPDTKTLAKKRLHKIILHFGKRSITGKAVGKKRVNSLLYGALII